MRSEIEQLKVRLKAAQDERQKAVQELKKFKWELRQAQQKENLA
jgi:hypothetical protein